MEIGVLLAYSISDLRSFGGKPFFETEVTGLADGIRADVDGNIWVGAGWVGAGYDGVHVFAPDGVRIGRQVPQPTPQPSEFV